MRVLFLGKPGAGKGVYAQFLTGYYRIPHLSIGHVLREHAQGDDELASSISDFMGAGKLVPDNIVIRALKEELSNEKYSKGFFLDGYPRNLGQAEALESITPIDHVIFFDADDEVIIERLRGRLQCGDCAKVVNSFDGNKEGDTCSKCSGTLHRRYDDAPERVKLRLEEYEKQTAPLIKHFKDEGILKVIHHNAPLNKSKEEFLEKVRKVLG